MTKFRLFEEIIKRSKTDVWEEAKLEWKLDHIAYASEIEVATGIYTCLCGHSHLKELCFIRNIAIGGTCLVGNCCVKKFMPELETKELFNSLRTGKPSRALAQYCFDHNIINAWERDFYFDVCRKRRLSPKQRLYLDKVRTKILAGVTNHV